MGTLIPPAIVGTLLAAGFLVPDAAAQAIPVEELTPAGVSGEYGVSVALDGDLAAIGARTDDGVTGNKDGAVHVWRHDGTQWVQEQKVIAADGALFDYFGMSVAIEADVLAVGAPYDDDLGATSGAVYIYRFQGGSWQQEAKLLEPLGGSGNLFGWQVALDGNVLLVQGGSQVLIYRHINQVIGWQMEQTILVDTSQLAFDVSGDCAAIGQYRATGSTAADGVVQVYEHDGSDWILADVLTGSSADSGDQFGHGVAVDGDVMAIGASLDQGTGSLYLMERSADIWTESARMLPSNGAGGGFGDRVALSGTTAVVVSRTEEFGYEYRKEKNQWVETAIFQSPISDIGFPRSVAVDGGRAILGSLSDHAYEFPASTLRLTVDPPAPDVGDLLTIKTHTGLPNRTVLVYVVDVNGIPLFSPLAVFQFGNDYAFTIQSFVPPGLSGLQVTFQSYGSGATGKLQASNIVPVSFQ